MTPLKNQAANLTLTYYKPYDSTAIQAPPDTARFVHILMIQPATLRLESNWGQENTTYFNCDDLQIALIVQLQMLTVKLAILIL